MIKPATWLERAILVAAAALLLYTGPVQDLTGSALLVVGITLHVIRTRGSDEAGPTPAPAT